ncbi:hypothetical protein DQD06_22665 [Salmonella enterica subsp. houtenae]|nr:hypothetical protein [Salmonella enterica subsp. houtenae]HAU3066609.1 hypothetical protein [Salmonella enterica subsp. houtenae]
MKTLKVFLVGMAFLVVSTNSMASGQNTTEIISCSLPGKLSRKVSLSINNETKVINYTFKKEGKVELAVLFNEGNRLRRLTDSKLGVTYYGFKRGEYSYVIDIINGTEGEEYKISFNVKKNNKVIQSQDCLPNSFRSDNITSEYITDIPYVDDDFTFP